MSQLIIFIVDSAKTFTAREHPHAQKYDEDRQSEFIGRFANKHTSDQDE